MKALALAVALSGCGLLSARAEAQTRAPFELRWEVDLPITAASAVIGSAWLLRNELGPAPCAPLCDRERLAVFDRFAAGWYQPDVKLASDLGVAALLGVGAALLYFDAGFADLALGSEAVLVTSAIVVTSMLGMRRPRPFLYGEDAPRSERELGGAAVSFPSGHTAHAFALALALFQIQHARHPFCDGPYWVLAGTLTLATGVGVTRIVSGDHFPSDVLAGALIGSAIGWLVPELHRAAPDVTLVPHADGLSLSGRF